MRTGTRIDWWAMLAIACGVGGAPLAAQPNSRFLPTPPFRAVELAGSDDLAIVAGARHGLAVRDEDGDSAAAVAGMVRGGVLRVARHQRLDIVAAQTPELRAATVEGPGDLSVAAVVAPSFEGTVRGSGRLVIGTVRAPQVRIVSQGVGDVIVRTVAADTLVLELHGAGDVRVAGSARSVSISVFGPGDCDARGLSTADLVVNASGSGNVQARSSRSARIAATGPGDVVVNGHPHCAVHASGPGEVVCG